MIWIALLIGGAAFVVLAAVLASVVGPLSGLRKSTERLEEVREEADRLRRNLDVLQQRASRLRSRDGA